MTRHHEKTTPGSTRRSFLVAGAAAVATSPLFQLARLLGGESTPLHVATNVYPWLTFYHRENRNFNADLDAGLAEIAAAGLNGFEPILNAPEDVDRLAPLLKKHGLELRSFYVNTLLHEVEAAEKSIAHVLSLAEKARQVLGTQIVVTNPSPISWNREDPNPGKNDEQLEVQAKSLDRLGAALRERGLQLAYHNHDMELRNAAREFHHMMLATKPENMWLCLDAHWIYRGCGNSQVALFDVVKLYGSRVCELHLRQSKDGIWTEAFGEGDIDYPRLARELKSLGVRPHLVLEQAVEQGSQNTMNAVEAHRLGVEYTRKVFG
ncbi:MAG: sugar phosphate isomerase/epimerase family protein [Thermogutta sp.]